MSSVEDKVISLQREIEVLRAFISSKFGIEFDDFLASLETGSPEEETVLKFKFEEEDFEVEEAEEFIFPDVVVVPDLSGDTNDHVVNPDEAGSNNKEEPSSFSYSLPINSSHNYSANNSMESESSPSQSNCTRTRINQHFPHPLGNSKPYSFLSAKRHMGSSAKATTSEVRPIESWKDDVGPVNNNCPVCKRVFFASKDLDRHIASDHYKKRGLYHCCHLCQVRYKNEKSMIGHVQFHLRKFALGVEHLVT